MRVDLVHLYRIRNLPQGLETEVSWTIFNQALIMISKRNGKEGWIQGWNILILKG